MFSIFYFNFVLPLPPPNGHPRVENNTLNEKECGGNFIFFLRNFLSSLMFSSSSSSLFRMHLLHQSETSTLGLLRPARITVD